MKLIINYDLMEKIKKVKQPYALKAAKENLEIILCYGGIYPIIGKIIKIKVPEAAIFTSSFIVGLILSDIRFYYLHGDYYKDEALKYLTILSHQLKEINIDTTRELLLDSEEYCTKYKRKSLHILQEKYIMVPTYNDEKDISVLQEHIIGSKEYILSIGSPTKVYKPAYART
ncbi:MAG: hypothetical protein WDA21_04045 [Bacilli bacterium]